MIRLLFFFFVILVATAFCISGFYLGRFIPFVQQWPLFEALRNTAAIIFAVVGAWLAIIYPERLKISFGKTADTNPSNGNVGLLLTPAVHSTIILVALLIIGITAPLLKQIPGILDYVVVLRGLSFLTLTVLTLWQVVIVVITIIPADLIKSNFDKEQQIEKTNIQHDKLIRKKIHDGN